MHHTHCRLLLLNAATNNVRPDHRHTRPLLLWLTQNLRVCSVDFLSVFCTIPYHSFQQCLNMLSETVLPHLFLYNYCCCMPTIAPSPLLLACLTLGAWLLSPRCFECLPRCLPCPMVSLMLSLTMSLKHSGTKVSTKCPNMQKRAQWWMWTSEEN